VKRFESPKPLYNIFIMLTDCQGNWIDQTTSDASGAYSFTNLTPGAYKIKFVVPNATVSPTHAGSNDNLDNDVTQGWTGFTACFNISSGESKTDIDAGFIVEGNGGNGSGPGSVADFVWADLNGNGIQDIGEPGLADVFVMLTDCQGNWKDQTTTDEFGHYSFQNLTPASYKIKFVVQNASVAPTHAGANTELDNDVNQGWTGFTDCFNIAPGQNRTDIDAGFIPDNSSCLEPIIADITNITCNDNGTSGNANDDLFSFDLTVTSGATGGWYGGNMSTNSATAHQLQSFGPYNITDGTVSFSIDSKNVIE